MQRPTNAGSKPALFGSQGELLSLLISVEPKLLEELLEALAQLEFPVNPQLRHQPPQVTVEFPAYSSRLEEVRDALRSHGFDPASLETSRVLAVTASS